MPFVLHIPGATAEQLAHGVEAAQAVFDAAGIDPWAATVAAAARQLSGEDVDDDMELRELGLAEPNILRDAEEAAIEACLGIGARPSETCYLSIVNPNQGL